jgi:sortase (surface protein transpeptidase)
MKPSRLRRIRVAYGLLQVGEELRTEDGDGRVRGSRVVESNVTHDRDAAVLAPTPGARLTLVACRPFDAPLPGGTQRFVVVAESPS